MRQAIDNVLDCFAGLDPTKMLFKIKLHLLVHIPDDIRRFGPIIGVATEIYECFNAIFRSSSVHSNHLAPSRDIAVQLARQEDIKNRISGGWWLLPNGNWTCAGSGVRSFFDLHPSLQSHFGWTEHKPDKPGTSCLHFH